MTTPIPITTTVLGYTWRPLMQTDAAALHQLEQDCALLEGNTQPGTRAEYAQKLKQIAEYLQTDTLCAVDAQGHLAAAGWITLPGVQHEYRVQLEGRVHPGFRGQGLGGFLLAWLEAQARRKYEAANDTRPAVLTIEFHDRTADAITLFEEHGFEFRLAEDEMHRDLSLPIPANPLPPGLRFVTWWSETQSLFYPVYHDAFRERPNFPNWSRATWESAYSGHDGFRPDLSLLALDGETGAGYAIAAIEHAENGEKLGWIDQIGVRPAYRHRGIGAAILAEAMRRFKAEGLHTLVLEVNINNPTAASVYRRLGFVLVKRRTAYRKSL